jgi:aminoglycoside 6-adenylyltransferase
MDLEAVAAEWARRREDVRALVLVGSRARAERAADEWSDYDLVAVVDDADPFLRSPDWLEELAPVLLSFVEATATGGEQERRVLFADGTDADFSVIPLARLDDLLARPEVPAVFARGYRVLVDKGVLGPFPTEPASSPDALPVHEFWYRALLSARKLRRGELHVAVQGCNCGLRTLLRQALEIDARAAGRDAWHQGRFLERWADPRWLARMPATVAPRIRPPPRRRSARRASCSRTSAPRTGRRRRSTSRPCAPTWMPR